MKFIRTGLTTSNFASLLHDFVYIKSEKSLSITGFELNNGELHQGQLNRPNFSFNAHQPLGISAKSNAIRIDGHNYTSDHISLLIIKPESDTGNIIVGTDKQFLHERIYKGELMIVAHNNQIRVILKCFLEDYVRSVIKAEMPAKYHLEAIKAQAVCARTYALHPRVNHQQDLCDVCDSYLCCQAFSGWTANENFVYLQACDETAGEIITYRGEPILSLFSSCAGGHTENFEDCFSDWETGLFPPQSLSYLKGVSENIQSTIQIIDEAALKRLWHSSNPSTFDSWSPQFRWSVNLPIDNLESTIHHRLSKLLARKEFAPFITAPSSEMFGSIEDFWVSKRGSGGTAIELNVSTSRGNWQLKKELTIRSLFKTESAHLERLPSAKIFFDQIKNSKQHLQSLVIHGLGHGHGVGMQQVGAQGMANLSSDYRKILAHYYSGVHIETI